MGSHNRPVKSVYVHVTFLKFGVVDTLREKFQADVLLTCRWREDSLRQAAQENPRDLSQIDWKTVWNPKVGIYNLIETESMRVTTNQEAVKDHHGYVWVNERKRFKGTFWEALELEDFPFDVQDLSVTVYSEFSTNEVILIDDPTAIHVVNREDFTNDQEWHLFEFCDTTTKELCRDPLYPRSKVEALTIKARAARKPNYFLFNHFLIICMLCSLSFTVFAIPQKQIHNRVEASFTLLLTTVAYKFVCNQSLPKLSYLTYLDQYVLCCLGILVVLPMWHSFISIYWLHRFTDTDTIMVSVVAFFYLSFNILFWLMIYNGPYKKRRALKEFEEQHAQMLDENIRERKKELGGVDLMNAAL